MIATSAPPNASQSWITPRFLRHSTMATKFPRETVKARLLERLKRSRSDPCYFNEHVLCRSPYSRTQEEWARRPHRLQDRGRRDGEHARGRDSSSVALLLGFFWTRKNTPRVRLRGWSDADRFRAVEGNPPSRSRLPISAGSPGCSRWSSHQGSRAVRQRRRSSRVGERSGGQYMNDRAGIGASCGRHAGDRR